MLWVRGRIHTLDPARPLARSLLADGGVVRALDEPAPAGAEVLDVPVVVPGLADAHGHISIFGEALSNVDLRAAASVDEVVRRCLAAAPETSGWLLGRGWDQHLWPGQALPDHAPLSAALPDRPVVLTRIDGHALWANAAALMAAGVNAGTRDPEGGRILRRADGSPTGVLVDAAMALVQDHAPAPDAATRRSWLEAAFARLLGAGLTQVHDAGADPATLDLLRALDASGALPLRVYAMVDAAAPGADDERARGPKPWDARGMLSIAAVKIYADGALGSRGALMFEPYADAPGERGLMVTPLERQTQWARAWTDAGFQIAVHAIGDRANALVLDLMERAPGRRPRLEHAQVLRREDLARLGRLGGVASVQPLHAVSDLAWLGARLGAAQLAGAYAWRSLHEGGARLAFGSDFPIEPPDPIGTLRAAVEREGALPAPPGWRSDERLPLEIALRASTAGPAWASFAESRRGTLAIGQDADLTALDADPFEGLDRARPVATVVAGSVSWRS